jgi:hypothetical protein
MVYHIDIGLPIVNINSIKKPEKVKKNNNFLRSLKIFEPPASLEAQSVRSFMVIEKGALAKTLRRKEKD